MHSKFISRSIQQAIHRYFNHPSTCTTHRCNVYAMPIAIPFHSAIAQSNALIINAQNSNSKIFNLISSMSVCDVRSVGWTLVVVTTVVVRCIDDAVALPRRSNIGFYSTHDTKHSAIGIVFVRSSSSPTSSCCRRRCCGQQMTRQTVNFVKKKPNRSEQVEWFLVMGSAHRVPARRFRNDEPAHYVCNRCVGITHRHESN